MLCAFALFVQAVNCKVSVSGDTFEYDSSGPSRLTFSDGNTVVQGVGENAQHTWNVAYGTKEVQANSGIHEWKVKILEYYDAGNGNGFEVAIGICDHRSHPHDSGAFWGSAESYAVVSELGWAVATTAHRDDMTQVANEDTGFNRQYGMTYGKDDEITVTLDTDAKTVSFAKNGVGSGLVGTGLGAGPFHLAVALGDSLETVSLGPGTEDTPTPSPPKAVWTDYEDVVCKMKAGDSSKNDDGTYFRYKGISPNTLDECKRLCLDAIEQLTDCKGVEYYEATGRCDLFTKSFTHSKSKSGRTCSALTWDGEGKSLESYKSAYSASGSYSLLLQGSIGVIAAVCVIVAVGLRHRRFPAEDSSNGLFKTVFDVEEDSHI